MERKFSQYIALSSALRRAKVPNYGATSTMLLECFIEGGGRLNAAKTVARKVCDEGKFSIWRDEMIKGGWLVWSQNQNDKGQYFAGKKLIPYLNKEKLVSNEVATRIDVAELQAQLNAHEERLTRIDEVVKELKNAIEPPDTEEKRRARNRATEKLTKLTAVK